MTEHPDERQAVEDADRPARPGDPARLAGSAAVTDVAPPATGVWYDPAATLAAVLAILRLEQADVDETRLAALIPAAAFLIDDHLDRTVAILGPPPAPGVQAALEQVTVVMYRTKDVGATGSSWLPADVAERFAQSDPITDVLGQLLPFKQRFGVA